MESITLTTADGTAIALTPLGTNAICNLEEKTGLTFGQIMVAIGMTGMERWSLRTTRVFLQACAPPGTTIEQIGALIDDVGFDGIGVAVNGLITPARTRG